jgi:peptidoglycan/LPS O-acetylase OafA/YrhL
MPVRPHPNPPPRAGEGTGGGRQNNFDALRLVAATSVIFSHSFLIAEGSQNREWLILLTGNQCILGLTGVFVFFAISGFLVTQSFERTANPLHYLAKRALRIFPGLFVATIASAFVLGPLVTTLPLGGYLSRAEPYLYILGNTLLDQTVHELPGVSFVDNPVGREINGSLWTLRLEFTMYLMVLVLGLARLLTVRTALLLLAFGIACLNFEMLFPLEKWGWFFRMLSGWGWLVGFFAAGMLLYKWRDTRIFDGRIAVLALAGLILSIQSRLFIPLFPVFGCYLALWLALSPCLPVIHAARFGDLSYGIYIYGWPVEEAVIWLFGGRAAWWQVFLTTLPTAAALAFLSWHLVERPMLRIKPGSRRKSTDYVPAAQRA